jgi:phosphopantetheinyl transferase (holo-ACP synthase)
MSSNELGDLTDVARWRAILLRSCAKEAAFKALDGLVDSRLTFRTLEVVLDGGGPVKVRILGVPGLTAEVAVAQDQNLTLAIAAVA